MKNIHGDYLKILGLVHYDERIINNMMVLTINFKFEDDMKKIIIGLLALGSISAFAQNANNKSVTACRIKCSSAVLHPKYVNGVKEIEVIREDGHAYTVEYRTIDSTYYTQDDLAPGVYSSDDPRVIKIEKEDVVCGIYLSKLNNNGDLVERLISDSITYNRATKNESKNLGNSYVIETRSENMIVRHLGLYNKEPIFIDANETKRIVRARLEELRDDGMCK